jgi:hypothetical protein
MTFCAQQLNEVLVGAALAAIDVCHRAIAIGQGRSYSGACLVRLYRVGFESNRRCRADTEHQTVER